jgi:hypothetical protein
MFCQAHQTLDLDVPVSAVTGAAEIHGVQRCEFAGCKNRFGVLPNVTLHLLKFVPLCLGD